MLSKRRIGLGGRRADFAASPLPSPRSGALEVSAAPCGTPASGTPEPGSLILDRNLVDFGTRLLDQQLWCWGRDVLHPGRNLLVEYGFTQHRSERPKSSTTSYSATHRCGVRIALWSWGVFFGDQHRGGVFLRRFSFAPQTTPDASLPAPHWPEGWLPPHRPPATAEEVATAAELLSQACLWIAHYESWIADSLGAGYRAGCLRDWRRRVDFAGSLSDAWSGLGQRIRRPNLNDIAPSTRDEQLTSHPSGLTDWPQSHGLETVAVVGLRRFSS